VEVEKKHYSKIFEVRPTIHSSKVQGGVFGKGRYLLGRTESCDLIVNYESVSAVHAVLEILENSARLFDMNSTNGTYVADQKIIVKEIKVGDHFRLGDVEFEFRNYVVSQALPPVLDLLEPESGTASVVSKTLPKTAPQVSDLSMPSVVYPLASDPKAEFSEYIFEDKDELYPIFKYEAERQAVEVIILFKDKIFSVDYLVEAKSTYLITGVTNTSKELEFPYLGKNDKFPFVDVQAGSARVHTLPSFDFLHLTDNKKSTHVGASIDISGQDLVRYMKGDLQIFVRYVSAPPKVASAPILKRDPDFRKYLFLLMFIVGLFSIGLNMIELPVDEKKNELAPERLATILYKQPLTVNKKMAVSKTEDAPNRVQKAPNKPVVAVKTNDLPQKIDPGVKTAPEQKVVKKGNEPIKKQNNKIASPLPAKADKNKTGTSGSAAKSAFESKSQGHVEVYKSADFKTTVNSLVAKGGSLSGLQTKGGSGSGNDFSGSTSGVSTGTGNVKTADISTNQGSLVGATTGVLGESKGAGGLSYKKGIYTAGIPNETVVLGSMDPDVIRRILLEYLPQFRYCYQKELERSASEMSGVIKLNFTIGASGHVAQAGVDGSSSLPSEVKRCVVGVLKGIAFPEPSGGGTVEVKQPMNFYPKKI